MARSRVHSTVARQTVSLRIRCCVLRADKEFAKSFSSSTLLHLPPEEKSPHGQTCRQEQQQQIHRDSDMNVPLVEGKWKAIDMSFCV